MKKVLFLILFAFSLGVNAQTEEEVHDSDTNLLHAALRGWHFRFAAGYNIGGTAPLPLPNTIREINSWRPGAHFSLEADMQRQFGKSNWGMAIGMRLESKGMRTEARVKGYYTEVIGEESGEMKGYWTGPVKTKHSLNALTFPILLTFDITPRWQLAFGPYVSWIINSDFSGSVYDGYIRDTDPTGERAEVTNATYDFSDNLRHFGWGAQLGVNFRAYKHFQVGADIQWGLNDIFKDDFTAVTFDMYPIYGNFHFAYLF